MLNRCRIDAKSTPEKGRARRIRGRGPGGPVPNKPLTKKDKDGADEDGDWGAASQRSLRFPLAVGAPMAWQEVRNSLVRRCERVLRFVGREVQGRQKFRMQAVKWAVAKLQ